MLRAVGMLDVLLHRECCVGHAARGELGKRVNRSRISSCAGKQSECCFGDGRRLHDVP